MQKKIDKQQFESNSKPISKTNQQLKKVNAIKHVSAMPVYVDEKATSLQPLSNCNFQIFHVEYYFDYCYDYCS